MEVTAGLKRGSIVMSNPAVIENPEKMAPEFKKGYADAFITAMLGLMTVNGMIDGEFGLSVKALEAFPENEAPQVVYDPKFERFVLRLTDKLKPKRGKVKKAGPKLYVPKPKKIIV